MSVLALINLIFMVEASSSLPQEFIPVTAPVHSVECESAFNQLDEKEAAYAYYMTRASWEGSKICWFQRSYESPALFVLLKLIFGKSVEETKHKALSNGVTEDEWNQFQVYAASVFNNCGNFKSFGDMKFVPQLTEDRFAHIIKTSANYATHGDKMDHIWDRIKREVYFEQDPLFQIGYPDQNGQSSYYSSNMTSKDVAELTQFCTKANINMLNTRVLKDEERKTYTLLICSQE